MTRSTLFLTGTTALALVAGAASAQDRQTITMWFWGASPEYREALDAALTQPFNESQDEYELVIEYRNTVDNDVRVSVMAGQGPDLVYTSGPSDVTPLARAGMLEPMEGYAEQYGWTDRLLEPVLNTCQQLDHLYCLPPSVMADGMFYNKAVLADLGYEVPTTVAELEEIMVAAMDAGMYGSVTGNSGWQPINENYSSIFMNQMVGPEAMYELLTGGGDWQSAEMTAAMEELDRWFKAGYLGGDDYFSLNFDSSLQLLSQGEAPFFFAPSFSYQWAVNYFSDETADNLGFTAFPNMNEDMPYPIYSIGSAFTYSINANSEVKDGAAMVLDMMFSPEFATEIARTWPGYWSIPLVEFPEDPEATGITAAYYDTMESITDAVGEGVFGFKVVSFFPPETKDVFISDLEAVWLDRMSIDDMLAAATRAFSREYERGLVPTVTEPSL
ncbi:ABC transporter substrate-binding protein [Pelagovum pacificum]|uniref:Carbohydrate ABC transporter substrate-binding protein n=1 Tax=Pelagovum pacificum TaxID=2588711 RepID=A0A5C5GBS0_9RHOB|nr:ABC transporter substrate-binding protein [Pelagovum pacificum]QQA41764.1 carbohydrate ABC transporter substrate-binding protein [Pelagovum pacificum]TNY31037.1 carbohydrate ABC transporter substrate-binding protein [Pelagovum pacificum]